MVAADCAHAAVGELLDLGTGAEVLAPARLRDAMAETIEALRRVYRRSVIRPG